MMSPRNLTAALVLMAAAVLLYAEVRGFPFLFDDGLLITGNLYLRSWRHLREIFTSTTTGGAGFLDAFYRPLQIFCYLLVRAFCGDSPTGFHFLNIFLHAANAVLMFALGRRLGLGALSAFAAALLWVLHPMHIEAVTYMSATADSLHTFFILLGLIALLPDFSRRGLVLGLIAFVAALLSKEPSIVFPGLMMALIFLVSDKRYRLEPYVKTVPFWLVAFIYLALRARWMPAVQNFADFVGADLYASSVWYRVDTAFSGLTAYARLILWPRELGYERAFPVYTTFWQPSVMVGFVLALTPLILLIKSFIKKRDEKPWAAWAALSFFIAYLPASGIFTSVNSLFLEHWMYLPSLFLFLGVAQRIALLLRGRDVILRRIVGVAVGASAVALALRTHQQNQVWRDPVVFYTDILERNPDSDRVRQNLAMVYHLSGDLDRAIAEYQAVLANTNRYPQTFYNLGLVYMDKKDWTSAEKYLLQALERSPNFAPAHDALAVLFENTGNLERSQFYRQKFRELRPDGP